MKFPKELNEQNKLKSNAPNNNFPLNNNNFVPLFYNPFPFAEMWKPKGINNNNFQEIIRPIPFPLFNSLNNNLWEGNYLNNYNIYLNFNNINLNRNIQNDNNNIFGKNTHINNNAFFLPYFNNNEDKKENSNNNKNILQKTEQLNDNNNLSFTENDNSSLSLMNDIFLEELPNTGLSYNCNCNSQQLFRIDKKRKRGRYIMKSKSNINRRIHDCNSVDNILRKVQVHFLSYIISFTNDLIKTFSPYQNLEFKNIDYRIKSNIGNDHVKKLKQKKIRDILQLPISWKYLRIFRDTNKSIFQEVSSLLPFLNDYFNMTYLEVFNKFYIKSEKVINFEGKNIYLSEKTKVFSDLLEKNKSIAGKIQILVENNFVKKKNKNLFIIQK